MVGVPTDEVSSPSVGIDRLQEEPESDVVPGSVDTVAGGATGAGGGGGGIGFRREETDFSCSECSGSEEEGTAEPGSAM